MPELVEHPDPVTTVIGPSMPAIDVGERAERGARADLRRQIAKLERDLGELFASAFPRRGFDWSVGAVGGPRVLSTAELERVRDALVRRLGDSRAELARHADAEEANRGLLERMIAEPSTHRWVIVSNQDIGQPGCRHWHSRPRWGLLGMLMGWWRIRLSSGCPLAEGPRPPASPAIPLTRRTDPVARRRRKPRPRRPPRSTASEPEAPRPRAAARAPARKPRGPIEEERPPAPWGSFPLVEVVVLIGLVMLVAALFVSGPRSTALLVTGLALGSLAGLELSIREHFGGYRSHTALLAAAAGVAVLALLFYAVPDLLPAGGRLAVGGLVTVATAVLLARAFRARSGRLVKLR